MFVCAFWSILLLSEYKKRNTAKVFLGFYMFVATLLYLGHAAYFNRECEFYRFWDSIYIFSSLAVYPLYFIYIKLISKKTYLEIKDFWILLPALFMMLFSFLLYSVMTPQEEKIFVKDILYRRTMPDSVALSPVLFLEKLKLDLFSLIFFVQIILIIYFGRKYIIEYNRKIYNYYSNTEGKTLQHFNHLLYIFIATSIASIIVNFLGKSFFIHSTWLLLAPSLVFGGLLFLIGYLGYKQDFTLDTFLTELKNEDVSVTQEENTDLNSDHYNENLKNRLLNDLKELLEKGEIFKQNDLRITDVSNKLNTNRTYISKIVNEDLKTNFSDLINNYRIEYAKKLLTNTDNESLGLSQIGELSGFKSDSSFYRIFKNKEGVSPGDFRKKNG